MTVSFEIPSELERQLRQRPGDVGADAKEAFLVSLYRQGRISHRALADALRLDRTQVEELLHRHNVTEDLGRTEDYLDDAKRIESLRKTARQ